MLAEDNLNYTDYTDEELVEKIQNGEKNAQEYLINKYKNLVKLKCRTYFLKGADTEDILQEGMIGLYKATRDYKKEKNTSFYSFAELCITRQIISAVKASTRQKHIPMNNYISLNRYVSNEEVEKTYLDMITEDTTVNPEELLIEQEEKYFIEKSLNGTLSELECKVLSLYLGGKSYTEMSVLLQKNEKSIDNALQRVRKKVEKIIDNVNQHG